MTTQLKYLISPLFYVTYCCFHDNTYHYFLFSCFLFISLNFFIIHLSSLECKFQKSNDSCLISVMCPLPGRTVPITYLPISPCFLNEWDKCSSFTLPWYKFLSLFCFLLDLSSATTRTAALKKQGEMNCGEEELMQGQKGKITWRC